MDMTCPDCGRPFGPVRKRVQTISGRAVCAECRDDVLSAAAGVIANPAQPIAGAIATQGWFRRLRRQKPS
jgi:hypothetical protein